MLKPQDILVILELLVREQQTPKKKCSQRDLSMELYISLSEINAALNRLIKAGLYNPSEKKVVRQRLIEFLIHGLKYVWPVELGGITRGVPTSFAVPPLKQHFVLDENDLLPVWPEKEGEVRGYGLKPLYSTVPLAVKGNPKLHELLALIDAIRSGRARERKMAEEELIQRISNE